MENKEKINKETKITEESVNLVRSKYETSLKQLRAKKEIDLTNCKDAIALLSDVIVQTTLTKEILQLKLDIANQLHQDYFVPSTSPLDDRREGGGGTGGGGMQAPYLYAQLIRDVPVNDPTTDALLYETYNYNGPLQLMPLRCGEWIRVWKKEGKDEQIWTCEWLSTQDSSTNSNNNNGNSGSNNSGYHSRTPSRVAQTPRPNVIFTPRNFVIPFWDRSKSSFSSPSTPHHHLSSSLSRRPSGLPTPSSVGGIRSLPISVTTTQRPSEFLNLEDINIEENSGNEDGGGSGSGNNMNIEEDPLRHEASNSSLFIVLGEWCKIHAFLGDLHSRIDKSVRGQRKQVLTLLQQQQAPLFEEEKGREGEENGGGGGGGRERKGIEHEHEDHVCQQDCARPCEIRKRQDAKEKFLRTDKSYRYKEQAITQLFKEFGQFDFRVFKELVLARMSLKKQIDELGNESGDGGQLKELWDKRTVCNLALKEAEDRWQLKEEELKLLRDRAVAARETTLIAACERCDYTQVEEITKKAKKNKSKLVNELDHGNGPLHVACLRGDTKIAHFLLMSGADPTLVDRSKGDTPLHYAARSGEAALMDMLLEYWLRKQENSDKRSFINARGRKGRTPLDTASHFSNRDAVKWLLSNGATPSVVDDDTQRTPLHSAARHGSMAVTKLLINAGGNPFVRNKNGETPLFTAVYYGHLKLVKFYLDQGAWLTAQEKKVLIQHADENKKIIFVLTTVLQEQMATLRGENVHSSASAVT